MSLTATLLCLRDVMTLTDRQAAVLQFIRDFIGVRGYGPSCREIGRHFGIAHNNARDHVLRLARKGALSYTEGTARSIVLGNKSYAQRTEAPVIE